MSRGEEKAGAGRFRVEEHLLPVGVAIVAVIWVVESVLDTLVFGEGDLLSTLFPGQAEELWNRGLLGVALLAFIGYAQRAVSGRRGDEELRSRVAAVVESSDDAIIGQTLEGVITSWNSGARSIYGYDAGEVLGKPITLLVPPDLPDEIPAILRKVRRGERVDNYETERVRKDGDRICVSLTVSPIRGPGSEEVVGIFTIARDISGRKRMEEALEESDQRFKSSFKDASIGIALVGTDGRWLQINRSLCQIVGYTEEELRGKTFQDITHPDDLEADLDHVRQLLNGEIGTYQMEKRYLHKDGHVVWILLNVSLVRDAEGEPLYFISQIQDITERRRAEEALRKSEARNRAILETAPDAILTVTADGIVRSFSGGAEKIFGYPTEEAVGRPLKMLMPERFRVPHEKGFDRYLRTGEAHVVGRGPVEVAGLRKDGEEFPLELSLGEMREEEDLLFVGVIRDITERKRAEEALKESEERFRGLTEATLEGVVILEDGEIVEANPAGAAMFGYGGPSEVIGRDALEFVAPECVELARRNRLSGYEEPYEIVGLKRDGTRFDVEVHGRASTYRGRPVRITAMRDITARKQAEEEIRRLNENLEERVVERTAMLVDRERRLKDLVGKLVAAQEEERRRVAYEVHDGPAQVAIAAHQHIQSFADDHPPGSAVAEGELDRSLELAQRTVREIRHIIENLRPTELDDFGLASAVRARVEDLKSEGWEIDYEEALGKRRLSPEIETALYRIAQEALNNARKHAGTTRARITIARRGRNIRLEVRDEGRGFDPAASSSGSNGPGERVGLSSMRERVAMLGGELRIMSKPGRGTSLVAEVPLPAASAKGGPDSGE